MFFPYAMIAYIQEDAMRRDMNGEDVPLNLLPEEYRRSKQLAAEAREQVRRTREETDLAFEHLRRARTKHSHKRWRRSLDKRSRSK